MLRHPRRRTAFAYLATAVGLASLLVSACTPPPPAASPASPAVSTSAASPPTSPASPAPAGAGSPASKPVVAPSPSGSPAAKAAASPSAAGAAPQSCKVAQVYTSPTSDKGWSWSHEQSFLAVKRDLPYVDLSIRRDSVPDSNQQAVTDLLESMVQQGAQVIYTTSFGFMEPTRAVAARYPNVAFFHASGFPGPNDPPNIGYYFATIEEARYITGEIAGLAVDPGANIGYVAAFPIPEVFRGENAFAMGLKQTNPSAKVYNKWTLTWFDPNLERQAAESLLEAPVRAGLITQHQDSTAAQLAAQQAGKWGIAYHANMNEAAPRATLTAATWDWTTQNRPTIENVCSGRWSQGGKVTIPAEYKNWMGSMKDGTVVVAPLNTEALASHPRKDQIQRLYDDEVRAFKAGTKNFETVFTGPIIDNTGQVRIQGKPDIGALYDQRGQWFVDSVVGSPTP